MDANDISALKEAAVSMHEVFLELRAAGFSEYQACIILAEMIRPRPSTE